VTKAPVREQRSDFAYWQSQPYWVRLATLHGHPRYTKDIDQEE